jgi:hypothetical protein
MTSANKLSHDLRNKRDATLALNSLLRNPDSHGRESSQPGRLDGVTLPCGMSDAGADRRRTRCAS